VESFYYSTQFPPSLKLNYKKLYLFLLLLLILYSVLPISLTIMACLCMRSLTVHSALLCRTENELYLQLSTIVVVHFLHYASTT